MKKTFLSLMALILVMLIAGCASNKPANADPASENGLPDFVRNARRNTPADTLIGIGSARLASQSQSKTLAESRARAELSRAMDSMIRDMIMDYQASSEVDPAAALAFQENITVSLSNSNIQGAVIFDENWINGTYYVVMHLSASNTVEEINQAQAAARLTVPAMAAFNAQDRMNAAFDREYARELEVRDY